MVVDRDYLFYGLRPKQEHAAEEGEGRKVADGLCWLTFPVGTDSIQSSVPNFFSAPPSHQTLNVVRDNVVPFLQRTNSSEERWMVIWNDQAGQKLAKQWLDQVILPVLNFAGIFPSLIHVEQSRQSGWEHQLEFDRCIILGGDGTVSDFLNQLDSNLQTSTDYNGDKHKKTKFDLIIVPLGTANAMFHAIHPELKDVKRPKEILCGLMTALLEPTRRTDGVSEPIPPTLTLGRVRTLDSAGRTVEKLVSFVVASTSLHASILDTANQLLHDDEHRSSGVHTFKKAFQKNASKTWNASVKLLPSKLSHSIERYDPSRDELTSLSVDENDGDKGIKLDGKFSYFTSCLIDRLESNFLIAPLRKPSHDSPAKLSSTIDVVIVRPMRDPSLAQLDQNSTQFQETLVKLIGSVMQAAYQGGHHLKLLASHDHQTPVVEYYRCGGWIWKPTDDENIAHQVCIDGKIVKIPEGGSVECTIIPKDETEIRVR